MARASAGSYARATKTVVTGPTDESCVLHNESVSRSYLASRVRDLGGPIVSFREYVFSNVLPAFGQVEVRAQQIANDYYNRLTAMGGLEDEIDMADLAEAADEHAYDWFGMMISLRQSMLNLLAAGLFHLVEQQLARLSNDVIFERTLQDTNIFAVKKWYQDELSVNFEVLGSWVIVNELRLVANAVKHGEGKSADELRLLNPDLFSDPDLAPIQEATGTNSRFCVLRMSLSAPLSGDDFFVTEGALHRYAENAERFFNDIAEDLLRH